MPENDPTQAFLDKQMAERLNTQPGDTSWMHQPRFMAVDPTPRPPHMQRVVDEQEALVEKITKLDTFIGANPLFVQCSEAEQERLRRQLSIMHDYSDVLCERIAAFPIPG